MRNAFAEEIEKLGQQDSRLVLLSGDIGNRLFDSFKAAHPDRFYNCGVAEANMMGVAAGMAMSGMKPVAYTITPFITTRCLEQIRVDVCYHNVPVTIVAVGAGLSYASLGPTHHACEDISFLRSLPNMKVVCPGDPMEVRAAIQAALDEPGPVYIRLGKKGEDNIHSGAPANFEIGKGLTLRDGDSLCILATGNVLPLALETADRLSRSGVAAQVVSFHTVKPLDKQLLEGVFDTFPVVATIEEHSLVGGLGSAIAEWFVDTANGRNRGRLVRFGTRDEFLKLSGEQAFAREYFGLTSEKISARLLELLPEPGVGNRR